MFINFQKKNRPMKKSILVILLICIAQLSFSQCENCPKAPESFKVDYCHTNEIFGDLCAQFNEKAEFFLLKRKKKNIQIKMMDEVNEKYLVGLAKNKKMKISALEMIFIEEALKTWAKEKMNIGYEFTDSGLGIKMIEEGSGELPKKGQEVEVHYKGLLEDGTQFDSSIDRGDTFKFPVGTGRVIKGWDEGIAKLKPGAKAWLKIPSELGYGKRGAGRSSPPNATLYFYVEMISIK
jgi:FKBP-type peptidyl-prolyl cis-trans isomerase